MKKILSIVIFFTLLYVADFYTKSSEGYTLAFLGIGAGKRRRRAGNQAKEQFTNSVKEGTDYYTDMYQNDFDLIQSGIGNFSSLADELKTESANPYLRTTEGMSLGNQIKENSQNARKNFSFNSGQLGMSDEAILAGLGQIGSTEGQSFRDLFTNADQRRAGLRNSRQSVLAQILSGQQGLLGQKMGVGQMGMGYGQGASGSYSQGFGQEAQRQAANTQAFTQLLGDVASSFNPFSK